MFGIIEQEMTFSCVTTASVLGDVGVKPTLTNLFMDVSAGQSKHPNKWADAPVPYSYCILTTVIFHLITHIYCVLTHPYTQTDPPLPYTVEVMS